MTDTPTPSDIDAAIDVMHDEEAEENVAILMGRQCDICGDTEPVHVHDRGRRIEDYFTVGRGESDIAAARRWKARALTAEKALRRLTEAAVAPDGLMTPDAGPAHKALYDWWWERCVPALEAARSIFRERGGA